jgi:cyanamide hydratase
MRLLTLIPTLISLLPIPTMAQSTPADHTNSTIEKFGWTSVPHAQSALLKNISPWNPANYTVADIRLPDSELANQTLQYAKDHLPSQVFNHSMRVYYYGHAIAHHHLPAFVPSLETYFLTCLLHDIGTTPTNIHGTLMSFEFYGGFLALDLLQEFGARKEQAESVAEAIIRHQDLGDVGTITTVGQLIQLATLFGKSPSPATLLLGTCAFVGLGIGG